MPQSSARRTLSLLAEHEREGKMSSLITRSRVIAIVFVTLAALAALAIAGSVSAKSAAPAAVKTTHPRVALLWPENVTPRWEGNDHPLIAKALKKLIPGVRIDSLNALNNPAKQLAQAEAELAKGAKVLIVAAIDGKAFGVEAKKAAKEGVKVIAYDRLISNARLAGLASFNSVTVGKVEAGWMASHTKAGGRLAIINGSPTDANAHFVNQGIHKVLNPLFKSNARIKVAEDWTPGWDPPTAQTEMEQILTKTNNGVDGVVSANDGMAGGIIAALKAQGLQGKVPTTGQDASLEGIQNVILGYQGVTAFKDIRLQANEAAKMAAAILKHKKLPGINGHTNNGVMQVPTWFGPVVAIDKSNVSKLVKNGWIKSQYGGVANVCKGLPKVSICK
jgi:D-xylose transport system substrate-binding protein